MDDTGFAIIGGATRPFPRRDDEGPAPSSTTAAPAPDAEAFARAVEALLLLALTIPASTALGMLARTGPLDWYLVSDAGEVWGTWLGAALSHASVWAQVDSTRLPTLGMVAVNDPAAVAQLAHERPWEAHATSLAALGAAVRAALLDSRGEVRVSFAGPDGPRAITVSAELLGAVIDVCSPIGDPARPVWAYLTDGDDESRSLVLDGGAWLAVVDDGHRRPLRTGRAAAPWHLALTEVVSTIDPGSVGGRRVPLLSTEAH